MRQEIERTLREMIRRDFNHPSIFAWVPFNETWGLFTNVPKPGQEKPEQVYRPETQQWVASVYRLAKSLDPTRLVEDNSVCCGRGHTETDINSWHDYLPGWAWDEHLDEVTQGHLPRLDVELRGRLQAGPPAQHQQRVRQRVGLRGLDGRRGLELGLPPRGERVPPPSEGRGLALHRAPRRHQRVERLLALRPHARSSRAWRTSSRHDPAGPALAVLRRRGRTRRPQPRGEGGRDGGGAALGLLPDRRHAPSATRSCCRRASTAGTRLGRKQTTFTAQRTVAYRPWMSEALAAARRCRCRRSRAWPSSPSSSTIAPGVVLHRNFTTFVVEGAPPDEVTLADGRRAHVARIDPARFSSARWSLKQWNVLDGLKVNGAGSGHFEYRLAWPAGARRSPTWPRAAFLVEASAKQLYGKDREDAAEMSGDYMRGQGTHDPSRNPNAYPMTDERAVPERGDGAGQRRRRRAPRAAGRSGGSPRDPVLARAAQGPAAAGGGLLRLPAGGRDPARGAGAGRRRGSARRSAWRWTRRCRAASRSTARASAATRSIPRWSSSATSDEAAGGSQAMGGTTRCGSGSSVVRRPLPRPRRLHAGAPPPPQRPQAGVEKQSFGATPRAFRWTSTP